MLSGKTFYSMEKDTLIVCLERELSEDVLLAVAILKPKWAVFLEQGFVGLDELKIHATQLFKEHSVTFLTV